jgi:hypothetical protein
MDGEFLEDTKSIFGGVFSIWPRPARSWNSSAEKFWNPNVQKADAGRDAEDRGEHRPLCCIAAAAVLIVVVGIDGQWYQRMCANEELSQAINERGFSYEYHYVNKAQAFLAAFTIAKCS